MNVCIQITYREMDGKIFTLDLCSYCLIDQRKRSTKGDQRVQGHPVKYSYKTVRYTGPHFAVYIDNVRTSFIDTGYCPATS